MKHLLCFIIVCTIITAATAVTFDIGFTTLSDFSAGEAHNILIVPDPAFPSAALTLSDFDTIRVLQVYPSGHCKDCLYLTVNEHAPLGTPPLNFRIDVITLDTWNRIDSLRAPFHAENPVTSATYAQTLMDYDIVYFGIANGYGGADNDLSSRGKQRVRDFAGLGRGIVLTHDTIAKRRGTFGSTTIGTFVHENFNDIADVTGLDAEWVPNNAAYNLYYRVVRDPSAPAGAPILNTPFTLPEEFEITACHEFGEHYADGQVWFVGPDGEIYMHTYHSPHYGSYASYFSTGHAEQDMGASFRPAPWEAKAMINAMYYSYFGGLGSGVYTSAVFSAPCPGGLEEMTAVMTAPGESGIAIELASSPDGILWSAWTIVVPGGAIPPAVADGPFYKFRVLMSRDIAHVPILHSISFHFDLPSPELELLYPPISSFYSCSCGEVSWQVHSDEPIDITSAFFSVNSAPFGSSRAEYDPSDSTLSFLGPEHCWTHGITYYGLVESFATLDGGCPRTGDTTFVFTADFRPPVFTALSPAPGSIIGDETPIIIAVVRDSTAGIQTTLFQWVINGDTVNWGETGLSWNGTTERLSLTTSARGLSLSGDVEICAVAGDRAVGCGANIADTCWNFYVDNFGPTATMISPPSGFLSCDSLRAAFILRDTSGIDAGSILITVGASVFEFPMSMSLSGDTLFFFPDEPVADGETLVVRFGRIRDNLGNDGAPIEFEIIIDQSPPFVWAQIPADGGFAGIPAPSLSFRIGDSLSGLNAGSIRVTVNGVNYYIADGTWDGELFVLDGTALGWHFEHDDTVEVCVRAEDMASGCGANVLEECWEFYVNLRGPICYIVGPPEGAVVGCDSFEIVFTVEDPNGVVPNSVSFTVNGIPFDLSSPEVSASGDTVVFWPSSAWAHGDVITVEIVSAEDSLGNALEHPCEWSFTVDAMPPAFSALSPPDGGVVDTDQPRISLVITDGTGVLASSIELCAEGDCWTLADVPTPLAFSGDTLVFDPTAVGHFFSGDSVFVRASACDSTEWCGPNCADIEWFFWIDNYGPRAELLAPDSGAFSSCADQGFAVRIFDISGVVLDSVEISVNGAPVRWPDASLEYIGDTLFYTPPAAWDHLDTVAFELNSAYDSLGNALMDTIFTMAIIDLRPPNVEIIAPLPGTEAVPRCTVRAVITDDGCGVNGSSIVFRANGTMIPFGGQLEILGDTVVFAPTSFFFPERETARVQIYAEDCAEYCGANSADTGWAFFVPDDDTTLPEWIDYSPAMWIKDSIFTISVRAVDISGIYAPSPPNVFAPFIVWDDDGEIGIDGDTVFLQLIDQYSDTFVLQTSLPIVSGMDDIVFQAAAWDDDFDFADPADRIRSDSPVWRIELLERAKIEMTFPSPGTITACLDQMLRFSIGGESRIDYATCVFEIAGENFALTSPELYMEGDSVFVFAPSGDFFAEGQVFVRLISAFDLLGNPLHTPVEWVFTADATPPTIALFTPNDGAMLDSANVDCEIYIYDTYSPVDEAEIALTVFIGGDSLAFGADDPAIFWDGGTGKLTFRPHMANLFFESRDSITVRVCAQDSPGLCTPNRDCIEFMFWIEPSIECSTTTDPFTPNFDGYNDRVGILWPGLYRDGAAIEIFDMRGVSMIRFVVAAGKPENAEWDGLDRNGRPCPAGLYLYVVEVDGKPICRGTITLAR